VRLVTTIARPWHPQSIRGCQPSQPEMIASSNWSYNLVALTKPLFVTKPLQSEKSIVATGNRNPYALS
jgi:hypothetical protein